MNTESLSAVAAPTAIGQRLRELEGIAHRGDFDLTEHAKHSGKGWVR